LKQAISAEREQFYAVIANPLRRCGVYRTARQHAQALRCPLFTHGRTDYPARFFYLHWHPNFLWQHPHFAQELREFAAPVVIIAHDLLVSLPVPERCVLAVYAFDRRAYPNAKPLPIPLLDPYPCLPKQPEGDPDLVGMFGFFGLGKGAMTVLSYAHRHKKRARFIMTLHPFAPPAVEAAYSEFKALARRWNMEVIDDWLEGQELADAMGECGFFCVLHRFTGIGASGSVTSILAVRRPVYGNPNNPFLGAARPAICPFHPDRWPTERELRQARERVAEIAELLTPERIFTEMHAEVLSCLETTDVLSLSTEK
jgi:hypothetical protein